MARLTRDRLAQFTWVWLAASACAAGQTVEGAIVDIGTGRGIAGAKVALWQGGPQGSPLNPPRQVAYSGVADTDGHFQITGIKGGLYWARFNAEHYSPSGWFDPQVQVPAAGLPVRVDGRLVPDCRISGRVIDGRGDAVAHPLVWLTFQGSTMSGPRVDAEGGFEASIPAVECASSWTLSAAAPHDWKPPAPDPDTREPQAWARTFYPGVIFREQAAPIALEPGDEMRGLEIKLIAAPTHTVRGLVLNPDGTPAPKASVSLWEDGYGFGSDSAYDAESRPDGTFEFPAVVEGAWHLSADCDAGGVKLEADEWMQMKGRDPDPVKLLLGQPFTVRGRVTLARISHHPSAATRDKAVSTSLRSTTVLNVLFKYASARWPSRASYPRPSRAFRDEA